MVTISGDPIPAAPIIIQHPQNVPIPSGTSTTLSVTAVGPDLSYQWYQGTASDTTTEVGTDSPNFTTPNLIATTSYWVRVTNSHGSADSNTATVTVSAAPLVTGTTPANAATLVPADTPITIEFSDPVNLSSDAFTISDGVNPPVAFTAAPPLPATGVSNIVLTPAAPLAGGTTYTVSVDKDEVTPAMDANHVFSFTTLAPVIIIQDPLPQNPVAGQNAAFTVAATGDGSLSYAWFKDGVTPVGTDSPTLTLTAVTPADEGDYHCVVTGPGIGNSATSASASLTITPNLVLVTGNGTYTQDFDGMGTTVAAGYPLAWTGFKYAGTGEALIAGSIVTSATNPAFTAGTGSGTAGTIYNFGTASHPDRALGTVASGPFQGAIGVSIRNDSGQELDGSNVKIGFTTEQWRLSNNASVDLMRFEYKIGGAINEPAGSEGWTPVSTFDAVEVDNTDLSNGAVDGNNPAYRVVLPATAFATLGTWAPGQVLHLRWVDVDATGNDAGLAIDDFEFITENVPPPPSYVYWDANGDTAGAGGPTPAGVWGLNDFWSTDADGLSATAAWTAGADAVFSAGSDATGEFIVGVAGTQVVNSITFEEGKVTVGGGVIQLNAPAVVEVEPLELMVIQSDLTGSDGLRKRGPGLLGLVGLNNTFTGDIRVAEGVLGVLDDTGFGDPANPILLTGGSLGAYEDLTLPVTRAISGAGGLIAYDGATFTLEGPVDVSALTLQHFDGDPVTFTLTHATQLSAGQLTVSANTALTGAPLTLSGLGAAPGAGSASIANDLHFTSTVTTTTVDSGMTLDLQGSLTLGGGGSDRLRKFGEGTLVLQAANPGLNKIALGDQSASPIHGGTIQIHDKDSLGATQMFFNYGTLEIMQPLTGDDALPIGFSLSGRDGSPIVIAGAGLVVAGVSNLFSGAGTSGDIVIEVNNHTTFSGVIDATTSATIDAVRFGGAGIVTLSGNKTTFRAPLKLAGTVSLELDTNQLGDASASTATLTAAAGATLHPGTDGSARLVQIHHSLALETGATLVFDVTGPSRGAQYDAIDLVTSAAAVTLAGAVEVRFAPAYVPQAGHAFQLFGWQNDATLDLADLTLDLPDLDAPLEWNTDLFESDGLIFIAGPGMGPIITGHPQPQDAFTGDTVFFTVTVIGEDLAYQWLFNGQPLPGAPDSPVLTLSNITAARTGLYGVTVSNSSGSSTSAEALLTVEGPPVIIVPPQSAAAAEGVEVVFTFTAAGSTLTDIQWQFNNGDLIGENGPTLTVIAGPGTYGNYRVRVENEYGFVFSVNATLSPPYDGPPTHAPEWDHSGSLPPGQIGLPYSFIPPVKPDDPVNEIYRSATSFTATGLPAGLKINADTGEVFGIPAAIKATPYNVKITARNVAGSAVLTTSLLINPLPAGALGVFTGPVQRSAILADVKPFNILGPQGGRFDMTVTAAGKVSGKITIGAKAHSFRSAVVIDPGEPDRAAVSAAIKRKGLTDLVLTLKVDTTTGAIVDATVSDGAATASFTGWRNPWSKNFRADVLAGYYTTKLELVDGALTSAEAPVGAGFLSFTVNPTTGKLTLKGRLADGSAITMATFAGPAGQILLFRPLYAAAVKGSVLGGLGIVVENVDDLLQNTVEGDLTWSRPANPAKSNRLYRSGFPDAGNVVELFATGARYLAPVKNVNPRVLGLTDANNLVEVFLTGANAEDALPLATAEGMKGTVSATNKVTFSNDFTINTRRAKLTFTAKTGAFKGAITLEENNPLLPEKKVKRPVTFQGLIVEGQGEGYFILNQLPAVIGDTPSNTPQQGGKVVVTPVVVP